MEGIRIILEPASGWLTQLSCVLSQISEIPSLLGPEQLHDIDQSDESMMNHPGAQVAEAAAAIDDGFGAFRPSTSFNDLSSLLPPADVPSAPHAMTSATATAPIATTTTVHYSQPIAPVVSSTSLAPIPAPQVAVKPSVMASPDGGKRKLTTLPDGPATKKQRSVNNTVRKNACAGPKKKAATGRVVNDGKKNTTPNPLKANSPTPALVRVTPVAPIAHAPKLELVKPIAKAIQPPPVVVTPPTTTQSAVVKTPPEASAPAPVAPAPVVSAAPPTEADFKSVAQAAVSNLIMNAGSSKSDATKDSDSSGVIDTSTEHIKALTGSNWVAVCNGGGDLPIDDSDDTVVDKMGNRARRQNLTPDERARQNRDRNREHARNTRLRKKAYVEELKRTLTALVSQRDASDLEKRHSSQRELEQREVRFRVAEEFLKLRGRNEANPARWAAILEDNFTLTLPVTDFREMVHSGDGHLKVVQEQVLTGVAETMRDSTMCSAFLQGLGRGHEVVTLSYNCDRKDFFMDNCTAMLEFTATSQGVVQQVRPCITVFTRPSSCEQRLHPATNLLPSFVVAFS